MTEISNDIAKACDYLEQMGIVQRLSKILISFKFKKD